ncbi:MAG TPA: hypothetical protein VHW72_03795 [Candidatus Angelobacter sp.]|nr:hypothetical protein [Candidatus Angelobacter sp.]
MATLNKLDAVSLAAAHGITPRTIASWNPNLPRTPRVMTPVEVDALVVRQAGGEWADCTYTVPPQNSPISSRRDNLPPPFKNLATPRPPGVYLHWVLPSALTSGGSDGTSTKFQALPDRWLVVRVFASRVPTRRAIRGWVLRAWDPPPNQNQATDQNQPPVVIDLDAWRETGNANTGPNPLTAAGPGDLTWSAYYDNVVNRLGFYDGDLQGVQGPLAYMVCGWYSDSAHDPLGSELKTLQDFEATMAKFGWSLHSGEFEVVHRRFQDYVKAATMIGLQTREAVPAGAYTAPASSPQQPAAVSLARSVAAPEAITSVAGALLGPTGAPLDGAYSSDGSWWPKNTLFHGYTVALGWPGRGFPGFEQGLLGANTPDGPPSASSIQVVLANTLTDGLGTLVAQNTGVPDEGRMMEAFTLGALKELEQPDGRARLDAILHATEFTAIDGGFTIENVLQQAMPPSTPPVPQPGQPGAGIFPARPVVPLQNLGAVNKVAAINKVETVKAVSLTPQPFTGRLSDAISALPRTAPQSPPTPAQIVQVKRPQQRWVLPSDPVFLLEGAGRSLKYGADGRFTQDDTLVCRLSGFTVTELACTPIDATGALLLGAKLSVSGDDLLLRGIENGSVPVECEELLRELVLLDPGSANSAAQVVARPGIPMTVADIATRFAVEQTAWWASWDPRFDPGPLLSKSLIEGTLPSPVAISPPDTPWFPVHLDWEVQFIPSEKPLEDWELGEIDYSPVSMPASQDPVTLSGRVHLTGGAGKVAALTIKKALEQAARAGGASSLQPATHYKFYSELSMALVGKYNELVQKTAVKLAASAASSSPDAVDRSELEDIASLLENMDVLSGALDAFNPGLSGGYPKNGVDAPADGSVPNPFFAFRGGFLQVNRLRVVDSFGQFVDLAGSSASTKVDPQRLLLSETVSVEDHPAVAGLPPRFTSQARIRLRFTSADGSDVDADDLVSPVCGYVMPNHLDGALEFFKADGSNLGFLRPDPTAGVIWEDAPGTASTIGQTPQRAMPDSPSLAGMAQALIDWGGADANVAEKREAALSAFLRVVDSSLWAVDPFGHIGDEHMSLLVGHPVVVLRAEVSLEVEEPIAPEQIAQLRIPIRLGSLTHWQDGLFGYFVNDVYTTLYCADAVAAGFARDVGPHRGFLQQIDLVPDFYANFETDISSGQATGDNPVTHPYVDVKNSGTLYIQPNQTIKLTLLVEPHSQVYLTTGLQPRMSIAMRRLWVNDALAKLSPTFRFGPVLVQPQLLRMPVAKELQGTWSWDHRSDLTTWAEDPVTNATDEALLPPDPAFGTEGWLRLTPPVPQSTANGASGGANGTSGTNSSGGTV